ncbi:hypothetical protein L207DRAFT_588723 [Hyaloscypha variabilis F]|uniref:Extensin domain-containing protein n=1 Tax=Hyaloscypha variabilis (strain UAMH 11265 / GT02V1 / F) TaxID=1149755 RepID=A0A2J6R6J2_HYAVF|nr:hypothetical protein L207DRAFT_588723 [Hyaloscypha variabilis F]
MNRHRDQNIEMGIQNFFAWRAQPAANEPAVTDDEIPADVDEPPDRRPQEQHLSGFHKSAVRLQGERKESLLTKAFHKSPESDATRPEIQVDTDLTRRRSMMSNASLASTAELTSDGGFTSPARTNTPSPPFPSTTYTSFAPYSLATRTAHPPPTTVAVVGSENVTEIVSTSPKTQLVTDPPRRRLIQFACDGKKDAKPDLAIVAVPEPLPAAVSTEAPRRRCTFACNPRPSDKPTKTQSKPNPEPKASETQKRVVPDSPLTVKKSPRTSIPSRPHRDSTSTVRHVSPAAVRAKPKFIMADEETLQASEATRFSEFASETIHEDDWIRKDAEVQKAKLTINDTLEKENRIRRLGNEAEQEALEDEDDDDDDDGNISDDEGDSDSQEEDVDDDLVEGSDFEASDGNETDNEAGFADSDDESDAEGDYAFWTPGRKVRSRAIGEASTYRASAHRTASASSIDSLNHMEPPKEERRLRRRPIKIRPGTPDLPDSTDFVCGTLDEDRPLEDAYVSCMELRKNAKHKQTPQDIDPSFPTSDPEDEEDDRDQADAANDSDEHVWLHGKFEESDEEQPHQGRRRSIATHRKSPGHSPRRLHSPPPRRLHSPPPPKHRLRSPPPRKLFGHSPRRMHSPPPARTIRSPPASPTQVASNTIPFALLATRPGLTHTKSLPRTPNAFCRQYQASRLDAATGNYLDDNDGPVRGAIDIVKGLEQKRQRRKEKFYQKHCNRKSKLGERPKPQPGKGAERMRELGLLMAGKTGVQDPYMMSA